MGLFNNKAKTEEAMERLHAKLKRTNMADMIMKDVAAAANAPENYWMSHSLGYYDHGKRCVVVGEDGITVFNCAINQLTDLSAMIKRNKRAAMMAAFSDRQLDRAKSLRNDTNDAFEELMAQANISINYTEYGYEPLSEYHDPQTGMLMDMRETLQVWANLLLEHMEGTCTNLYINNVLHTLNLDNSGDVLVAFSYSVPVLQWKSWF